MADNAQQSTNQGNAQLQSTLAAFRHIGVPLLQSMTEATSSSGGNKSSPNLNPEQFNQLVDTVVSLNRALTDKLGGEAELSPAVRWTLAASASQVVAAGMRATGRSLSSEEVANIATLASALQEKFKGQMVGDKGSMPNNAATFRAQMTEALVPVIGAVAQYAFGRAEHALLAEVAEQLVKSADQVTRSLAPAGATQEQWRVLCWNILRAAGQIYAECHFAEADRLLYMNPEDRAAYFAQHNNVVPMTQVWQAFRQRMAMLATLAMYLEVPEGAQLEQQSWP